MKNNLTLKILTLSFFIAMMIGYVEYKSGIIDSGIQFEFNSALENNIDNYDSDAKFEFRNTTNLKSHSKLNPVMLSTSKSAILIDQRIVLPINNSLATNSIIHSIK